MNNIYGITREDLEQYFLSINEKKYKALQVYSWLYEKRVHDFTEMSDIKKSIQERLAQDFSMDMIKIVKVQHDKDTHKYLFELLDGNHIEAVLMNHDYGLSVCVSSEVGCNMGCKFCESGRLKKVRNLEAYEMVEQILLIEAEMKRRISSVVVMGIGEPLDNYDNLVKFIKIINDAKGIAIGARHITVSTCGLVPKIKEFMELPLQVNLALSLHAPNDEVRNQIMKINKRYKIEEVIEAVKEYIKVTNRRITFEYILLKGINDTPKLANQLADLVKDINCYVNLIPYNEVSTKPFKKTSSEDAQRFFEILHQRGINATLRMEHGSDISAACGQLRAKKILEENNE